MSLSLGNTSINGIYLGNTKIGSAYLGNTLVYQSGPVAYPYLTFESKAWLKHHNATPINTEVSPAHHL